MAWFLNQNFLTIIDNWKIALFTFVPQLLKSTFKHLSKMFRCLIMNVNLLMYTNSSPMNKLGVISVMSTTRLESSYLMLVCLFSITGASKTLLISWYVDHRVGSLLVVVQVLVMLMLVNSGGSVITQILNFEQEILLYCQSFCWFLPKHPEIYSKILNSRNPLNLNSNSNVNKEERLQTWTLKIFNLIHHYLLVVSWPIQHWDQNQFTYHPSEVQERLHQRYFCNLLAN